MIKSSFNDTVGELVISIHLCTTNAQHFHLTFNVPLRVEREINKVKLILSLSMLARLHQGIIKQFSLHACYYGNKFPSNIKKQWTGGGSLKPFSSNTRNFPQIYCLFLFDSDLNIILCFTPLFLWKVNQKPWNRLLTFWD